MKICAKCKLLLSLDSFTKNKTKSDGHNNYCKDCSKQYRLENQQKLKDYLHQYYIDNKEEISKKSREHNAVHKEEQRARSQAAYDRNKDSIRSRCKEYALHKRKTDSRYKLYHGLMNSIRHVLKHGKEDRIYNILDVVGCSLAFLKKHLAGTPSQDLNIDHIIPVSAADSEEEFYLLFNWRNLQLIPATDNRRKHNKYTPEDKQKMLNLIKENQKCFR